MAVSMAANDRNWISIYLHTANRFYFLFRLTLTHVDKSIYFMQIYLYRPFSIQCFCYMITLPNSTKKHVKLIFITIIDVYSPIYVAFEKLIYRNCNLYIFDWYFALKKPSTHLISSRKWKIKWSFFSAVVQ